MSNMSYCQFENTSRNLAQVIETLNNNNWDIQTLIENASSANEARAMRRLIDQCKQIAENFNE